MPHTTSRGLPYPDIDDGPADVPLWLMNLAVALNTWVEFGYGLRADRPVSTPGSPGKQGRVYVSSDFPGILSFDQGTSWLDIGISGAAVIKNPAGGANQTIVGDLTTGTSHAYQYMVNNGSGLFEKAVLADPGQLAFAVTSINFYSFEIWDDGRMRWGEVGAGNEVDTVLRRIGKRTLSVESSGVAPSGTGPATLALNGAPLPHPFLLMGS